MAHSIASSVWPHRVTTTGGSRKGIFLCCAALLLSSTAVRTVSGAEIGGKDYIKYVRGAGHDGLTNGERIERVSTNQCEFVIFPYTMRDSRSTKDIIF